MILNRVLIASMLLVGWQTLDFPSNSGSLERTADAIGTVASQISNRKIYQHSVIPGGVFTGEELARVRRIDPVVAEHYTDFGSNVYLGKLRQDELVYISYRKADKVYWTKTKHRVCQGEAVVTDGKNVARSRCGNRLSKTPQLPTADKGEPTETALNRPDLPIPPGGGVLSSGAGPGDGIVPGIGSGSGLNQVAGNQGGIGGPAAESRPGSSGAAGNVPSTSTGASGDLGQNSYYVASTPYFAAGPLIAPGLTTSNTGGGTGTTTGTTTTGTTTTTTTTTTTSTATPEPRSIFLVFGGVILFAIVRSWLNGRKQQL